jgi:hypothetical protein
LTGIANNAFAMSSSEVVEIGLSLRALDTVAGHTPARCASAEPFTPRMAIS